MTPARVARRRGAKGTGLRERLVRLRHRLNEGLGVDRLALLAQLARYGIVGVGVTLFQIAVYDLLSGPVRVAPLIANGIAYLAAMAIGYATHSRYSFEGHGRRGSAARTGGRFVVASLIGFAINSLWVWLFTGLLRWPHWTPSLPMFFVTPFALFWLNRKWVFE